MTRLEHLLTIVAEESAEVGQRASKALRFGLQEVQPGQHASNVDRLLGEVGDLLGALDVLLPEWWARFDAVEARRRKRERIEHYLAYSEKCGTLTKDDAR